MKQLKVVALTVLLSGCSSINPVDLLTGSKPEITAQAGAESVKQTVGITAKQDASSKQENTFKESKVDTVDTSNKKEIKTSTIQADNITADRIEIRNNDGVNVPAIAMGMLMFIAGMFAGWSLTRKKEA